MMFTAPSQQPGYLGLLTGTLDAFQHLARHERSGWLLGLAHDICDPQFQRGNLHRIDPASAQTHIVPVQNTDTLQAGEYVYLLPPGLVVPLSKMSCRQNKSKTSNLCGNASTMQFRVVSRDEVCWINDTDDPVINSRILPKRLGDLTAAFILVQFCPGTGAPESTTIHDTIFGITLSTPCHKWFDAYDLGFRYAAPGVYECHVFKRDVPGRCYTIYGRLPISSDVPLLHGHHVSPPRPTAGDIPPAGLFRWHYLQCVLKHFAHPNYRNLPHIITPSVSIRIEDDDKSDSDSDSDSPADWPSAVLDHGRLVLAQEQEDKNRHAAVAAWISSQ